MGRKVALVLVWTPIMACLAVAAGVGKSRDAGRGKVVGKARVAPAARVVALMRSAPLAAETEGGMPIDLLRLIDDPVLARAQPERASLLYRRWALRSPLAAGQSALANGLLFGSEAPLEAVFEEWLATDPEAAMAWAVGGMAIPGKAERLEGAFAEALARKPVETRALWAARFPDDPYLTADVASEWVRHDAVSAVDWLRAMPPGAGKSGGLRALVGAWMEEDPASVGAFVATMEPGHLRDMAVATVAEVSPGGVALESESAPVARNVEESEDKNWLVQKAGKAESPRTLRRKPAGDVESD